MFEGLKSREDWFCEFSHGMGGSRFETSSERSDVGLLELVLVRYLTSVDWTAIQPRLFVAFLASV